MEEYACIFTTNKTDLSRHAKKLNFEAMVCLNAKIWPNGLNSIPAILGEELLIITSEYDRFDKTNERLDLLALDKDGNLVVIELKRDDSGKNVDLQAIKYAAYCSTLRLADI